MRIVAFCLLSAACFLVVRHLDLRRASREEEARRTADCIARLFHRRALSLTPLTLPRREELWRAFRHRAN